MRQFQRVAAKATRLAAALALCACVDADALRLFPDVEIPDAGDAPWPDLAAAAEAGRALPPPPDPAEGEAIVRDLTLEAAVMRAEAERLSVPVFEVEALQADAAALRRERAAQDAAQGAAQDPAREAAP
ncbi:hypothetical protein [Rubrimonas cliftonensis]|uniref:DUF4398 domain-containing protein n=1 Tax=Rubrimonas cliftonensis TaxID=89524 RepID=A0A1H3VY04_9RHOB|nr:hypothetical protein [Rubrimonas cliftonensis]SDZ79689.1 hypothetical protein SAMN05444370_101397 [Rubrimonas cliftonensis]